MAGIVDQGGLYIDLHGASAHTSKRSDTVIHVKEKGITKNIRKEQSYNEKNPGFGLRYELGGTDLTKILIGGGYINSLGRPTFYAGGGAKTRLLGGDSFHLDGGLLGGLATGYNDSVVPMAMPMLHIGGKRAGLNLMYAPAYNGSPATYMLSGQWRPK